MTLKADIQSLKRNDGKINSAIIRRDSFKTSDLNKRIISRTSYLPNDSSYSERFFHIEENIQQVPLCSCGNQRSFSKIHNAYLSTCGSSACVIKGRTIDYTKAINNKKEARNDIIDDILFFVTNYTPPNTIDDIKAWSQTFNIKEQISYAKQYDILKSIVFHTSSILPPDLGIILSQRLWHICNDTYALPICKVCNTNTTSYINFFDGYRLVCSSIDCIKHKAARSKRDNTANVVRSYLHENDYKIIKFDFLNSGNECTLECPNGHIFSRKLNNGIWNSAVQLCTVCNPSTSTEENNLSEYIESIYTGTVNNGYNYSKQSSKEIDIFIPQLNLGFEYNGIYWHSYNSKETIKEKNKHLDKLEEVKKLGIRLININSLLFKQKENIFKSRILNLLKRNNNKIYARKCTIRSLSSKEERLFFNTTHIQGSINSKFCFGLIYNGEIVSAMSFSKNRFDGDKKENTFELLRFSSKLYTTVIGGANKLFKYAVKEIGANKIISYADRSWGDGGLYNNLGFKFICNTPPNYIYYKNSDIVKRYSAQKHKLPKLLGSGYDTKKTEYQNMFDNGYRRYWDCGSSKWMWTASDTVV